MTPPTITCPRCHWVSAHPVDIEQGYCGNCHAFTSDLGAPVSFDEPQPTEAPCCPVCSEPAVIVLSAGHQAFCGNVAGCKVIMWDPTIPFEDQAKQVLDVPPGGRVDVELGLTPDDRLGT